MRSAVALTEAELSGSGSFLCGERLVETVQEMVSSCAVRRESVVPVDPQELSLTLGEDALARIALNVEGDLIRPEGMACYTTRGRLSPKELELLQGFFEEDYRYDDRVSLERLIFRVRREGGDPHLYHMTNALSYTFSREVGWIDPEDLSWLAEDQIGIDEWVTGDIGCFSGLEAITAARYTAGALHGGCQGHGPEIFSALGVPINEPPIRDLMDTALLLEFDPRVYEQQLPDNRARVFVMREHDINEVGTLNLEVAAPILPTDQDPNAFRIVAAVKRTGN